MGQNIFFNFWMCTYTNVFFLLNSMNKNGLMSRSLVMVANNKGNSNNSHLDTSANTTMTQSVSNMTHSFLGIGIHLYCSVKPAEPTRFSTEWVLSIGATASL